MTADCSDCIQSSPITVALAIVPKDAPCLWTTRLSRVGEALLLIRASLELPWETAPPGPG